MTEMTAAEIARAFAKNDRDHERFVTRELHDEIIRGMRDDVQKMESTLNKLIWAIVALFFTIVGDYIISAINSGVT